MAMQFTFRDEEGDEKEKPMCSTFLGTSPEFEIAAYTICFFTKQVYGLTSDIIFVWVLSTRFLSKYLELIR